MAEREERSGSSPASSISEVGKIIEMGKDLIDEFPGDGNLESIVVGFSAWGLLIERSRSLGKFVEGLAKENAELKRELRELRREKSGWMIAPDRPAKRAKVEVSEPEREEQVGEEAGEKSGSKN